MTETKVNFTNSSPKLATILLLFIAMNTCTSMVFQEQENDIRKQQLAQAKKQYTLDSLRYKQDSVLHQDMLRFQDAYLHASQRQNATDSLLNVAAMALGRDVRAKTKQTQEIFDYTKKVTRQR